jgi:hypothetical protein
MTKINSSNNFINGDQEIPKFMKGKEVLVSAQELIVDNQKKESIKRVRFNTNVEVVIQQPTPNQDNNQSLSFFELNNFCPILPFTCFLFNNCESYDNFESYDNSSQEYEDRELKCSKAGIACCPIDFILFSLCCSFAFIEKEFD